MLKGIMMLEGKRLIVDAVNSGVKLKTIYFSVEEHLRAFPNLAELVQEKGLQLKMVFHKDMQLFSQVVTSPGLMGIFERPPDGFVFRKDSYERENKMPVTVIADNVRDPGNLGSMIRSAAAAGIERVICTRGCVDVWEPKVVRGGAGAHFRIPVLSGVEWPEIPGLLEMDGGEARVDLYFAESLTRRMPASDLASADQTVAQVDSDSSDSSPKSANYSQVDFFQQQDEAGLGSVALLLGGEAEGLSPEALELISHMQGTKVWIPLSLGVESLNTSVAASIILYEMRRQFLSPFSGVLAAGQSNQ